MVFMHYSLTFCLLLPHPRNWFFQYFSEHPVENQTHRIQGWYRPFLHKNKARFVKKFTLVENVSCTCLCVIHMYLQLSNSIHSHVFLHELRFLFPKVIVLLMRLIDGKSWRPPPFGFLQVYPCKLIHAHLVLIIWTSLWHDIWSNYDQPTISLTSYLLLLLLLGMLPISKEDLGISYELS